MGAKEYATAEKKAPEAILRQARVLRIGLSDDNVPYVVPVCFGLGENCLYIHSSPDGKKLDIMKRNNNVCFQTEIDVEVLPAETPCKYDVAYKSVIGYGRAHLVEDDEEKTRALTSIVEHYAGPGEWVFPEAVVDVVTVIRIEIDSMHVKSSKTDDD